MFEKINEKYIFVYILGTFGSLFLCQNFKDKKEIINVKI